MKSLAKLLESGRSIRVLGFDDAPFLRSDRTVNFCGVVCSDTRFEGMLWGEIDRDGFNATNVLADTILSSKFYRQINVILLDGVTMGGFNVINMRELFKKTGVTCVSVMRKYPDIEKMRSAISNLKNPDEKWNSIEDAGVIHNIAPFFFQVIGEDPEVAAELLKRLTDTGNVPEPLRIAHMIGAAVKTGQSGNRA